MHDVARSLQAAAAAVERDLREGLADQGHLMELDGALGTTVAAIARSLESAGVERNEGASAPEPAVPPVVDGAAVRAIVDQIAARLGEGDLAAEEIVTTHANTLRTALGAAPRA